MIKHIVKYITYLIIITTVIVVSVIAATQYDEKRIMFALLAAVLFIGISIALSEERKP